MKLIAEGRMTAEQIDALLEEHGGEVEKKEHEDYTTTHYCRDGTEVWVGLAEGGHYPSLYPFEVRREKPL